jgi:hypothetical protein
MIFPDPLLQIEAMTPFKTVRRALDELASDAPWGERSYRALQELKSLTVYSWFDPAIAEMINEASDATLRHKLPLVRRHFVHSFCVLRHSPTFSSALVCDFLSRCGSHVTG